MKFKDSRGLTMVELVIVVGIMALLFSIGSLSLLNIRVVTVNNTSTNVIISDLKNQQVRAMSGDTEGRGTPDNYGIKILSDEYILFHGSSYNASDATNYSIPVDTGYVLTSTFPSSTILFASRSGEIVGFTTNLDTITLTNSSTGLHKTIHLNKYGTVTSVN